MAGTTNDKLNQLRQTKEAFRTEITRKGQTISANEPFSTWPAKVAAISTGGVQLPALSNPGGAEDLAKGKEMIGADGKVVTGNVIVRESGTWGYNNGNAIASEYENWTDRVVAQYTLEKDAVMYKPPVTLAIGVPFADFGDAQPSDVTAGKIFTSAAGLRKVGTGSGSGGGVQLPTLTNPGKAADLAKDKQLIDQNGNIVIGTALIPGGSFVFPDGAFAPVAEFTDGKQYAIVAVIDGVRRYINTTTYNNYTMNATTVTIAEDTEDYVIFSSTPALFTAVASGNGFLLKNGNNYLHGTTSNGTALRVGTTQAVWTVDTSATGGFADGKYHAKEDPNAVWLKNTNGGYDWSIKFETAGSFGYERSGRDNTYSTGFVSFVLYEYVAGEGTISPIVDSSDGTLAPDDMAAGSVGYSKGQRVVGTATVVAVGQGADMSSEQTTADVNTEKNELRLESPVGPNILFKSGSRMRMSYPLSGLGDAQPSDVAAGKIFTSAAGLLQVGTGSGGGNGDIKAQAKTVTPSTSQDQVITPDNGYNYLSQVTVKKIPYVETPNSAGGTTVTIG